MSAVVQQPKGSTWGAFFRQVNSLHWYDIFTSFCFRFMAKTSEPLLAIGVIISAIDFLQKGQLLANNPELSLWWSIAQGVAMEVSVGPVLVNALDAREEHDPLKAKFYAGLAALLAFVGGAMLLMQFGLSVGGLSEHQISPLVLWPLFVVRTVASISYIALSCTKHKRFSGTSPKAIISETNKAFEDVISTISHMHQQSIQVFTEQMNSRLALIDTRLAQAESTNAAHMQSFIEQMNGLIDARCVQMEEANGERLQSLYQEIVDEVSVVRVTLEEHTKVIKRIPERTISAGSTETTPLRQFHSVPKSSTNEFDKKKFVTGCITEHQMNGADIQRKAQEIGQTVSAGYISDIKKTLQSEHLQAVQ